MSRRHSALAGGLALGVALVLAACGSTSAGQTAADRAPAAVVEGPMLATSLSTGGGASWAVVQMGGPAATHENFWELFVRPAGTTTWKLATPPGVASNGGLVMAATGATSLIAGFRPSQDLTFSPLATTTDAGGLWSQNTPLSPGLGDVPYALAGTSDGQLLGLTNQGSIELGKDHGTSWTRLSTQEALARSAATRTCGITALTGVAWTPAGDPLIATGCRKAGTTGIFAFSAGAWQRAGPMLPAVLGRDQISVVGLATAAGRTTAILAARSGDRISLVAAWSGDGGTHWTLSPALPVAPQAGTASSLPAPSVASVSIWAGGSAGIVLPASHAGGASSGVIIGWRATGWRTLPRLPAGTVTLAAGSHGQPQALSVSGRTMTALQLVAGSAGWRLAQTMQVSIPYGSSG
jgi:hypothetical protein